MRSATRLVIVALSVLFLAFPAVSAAAERVDHRAGPVAVGAAAQPGTPTVPSQPADTAPAGPTLEPADTEADRAEQRRKIVMGVASAILVGIVVWGRSIRKKKAKAG